MLFFGILCDFANVTGLSGCGKPPAQPSLRLTVCRKVSVAKPAQADLNVQKWVELHAELCSMQLNGRSVFTGTSPSGSAVGLSRFQVLPGTPEPGFVSFLLERHSDQPSRPALLESDFGQ